MIYEISSPISDVDPNQWREDFGASATQTVQFLAGPGVKIVGIDTPSVDLFGSSDLATHKAFLKHDLPIPEGLRLRDVPEGMYELVALPLNLSDATAAWSELSFVIHSSPLKNSIYLRARPGFPPAGTSE